MAAERHQGGADREDGEDARRMPGIKPSFSQPIRDNVLECISQIDGQIVIKLFGDDSECCSSSKIDEVLKVITPDSRGRRALSSTAPDAVPQLQIEIDRERAARYGLNVADIEDVIETALGGRPATQIWEGEKDSAWWSGCGKRSAAMSTRFEDCCSTRRITRRYRSIRWPRSECRTAS